MNHNNIYRDDRIHVCKEMCSTCVFRPGNLMQLRPGALRRLIDDAIEAETAIVCHCTLDKPDQAVCRGFFDRHKTTPLQIAERLDRLSFVDAPEEV